ISPPQARRRTQVGSQGMVGFRSALPSGQMRWVRELLNCSSGDIDITSTLIPSGDRHRFGVLIRGPEAFLDECARVRTLTTVSEGPNREARYTLGVRDEHSAASPPESRLPSTAVAT